MHIINKMERLKAIYKLINSNGIVEYVGQAYDPYARFASHTRRKDHKFYNRKDIKLEIIEWVPNIGVCKKEEYWQLYYGLPSEYKRPNANKKIHNKINSDPEKRKNMQLKRIATINADPEKKKEMYKIIVEKRIKTMKLNKLKKQKQNEIKES